MHSNEFAPALAWLRQQTNVALCETLPAASQEIKQNPNGGILIATGRPGRFCASEIESLHRLEPLSPLIALVGRWCDGEARSGKPWPGVPRIAWHSWRETFEQLWGAGCHRRSSWLPRIATDVDRLVAQPPLLRRGSCQKVAIHSDDSLLREVLSTVAAQQRWQITQLESEPTGSRSLFSVEVCLWDWSPWRADESARFEQARQWNPATHFVVLRDFVRPEFCESLQASGPATVLGKPFSLPELLLAIASCEKPAVVPAAA